MEPRSGRKRMLLILGVVLLALFQTSGRLPIAHHAVSHGSTRRLGHLGRKGRTGHGHTPSPSRPHPRGTSGTTALQEVTPRPRRRQQLGQTQGHQQRTMETNQTVLVRSRRCSKHSSVVHLCSELTTTLSWGSRSSWRSSQKAQAGRAEAGAFVTKACRCGCRHPRQAG